MLQQSELEKSCGYLSKVSLLVQNCFCYYPSTAAQEGNAVRGHRGKKLHTKKTLIWDRDMALMRRVAFVPHHLDWKRIKEGQYEQEERL